jgi:hypothetical protein
MLIALGIIAYILLGGLFIGGCHAVWIRDEGLWIWRTHTSNPLITGGSVLLWPLAVVLVVITLLGSVVEDVALSLSKESK